MLKKNLITFVAIVLCLSLTGCSLEIPSLSEAKDVISAVMQYSESGELPDNVQDIIAKKYPDDPDVDIKNVIVSTSRNEALSLAKKYYGLSWPNIESDTREQFGQLVTWNPEFDGKSTNKEFCSKSSLGVATLVTYTNAKNFYLALACAVFDSDPENANAGSNLATAISTYCDELLSEGDAGALLKKDEFYGDALRMYYYALGAAAINGKDNEENSNKTEMRPAILANLGNLLLDMKRFDDALAAFKAALEIDEAYWPAHKGLYNYYMAVGQYKKALDLVAKDAKYYPAFAKAVSDITKKLPGEDDIPTEDTSEAEFEKIMDDLNKVPAVTSADFIQQLDPQTAAKMNRDIGSLQKKMSFKSPDVECILQYASFDSFKNTGPQAALAALAEYMVKKAGTKAGAEDIEAGVKENLDMLEKFGVDVDLGFDIDNLDKMVRDAIKNPDKYENYEPDVKISGLDDLEGNVQKYAQDTKKAMSEARRGDSAKAYEQLAKLRPEYKIMTINPYTYINPNDLLIQRYNVLALGSKLDTYKLYLLKVNTRVSSVMPEISEQYSSKIEPLQNELQAKIDEIEKENISDDEKKVKKHRLHIQYFARFNNIGRPYWGQATEAASVAYRKICKYSEQMYSDCMKHIMLISDAEVRDRLEQEVRTSISGAFNSAINNIITAYSIVNYYKIETCGCDPDEIRALEDKIRAQAKQVAKALEKKNLQDKKRFEAGILDENSKYYKEFIKKYEVECNFIFVKGKLSPYKSNWEASLKIAFGGINLSSETNHIRNTTTYEGGIDFCAPLELDQANLSMGLSASFGFKAVRGSDGLFSPDDIDIRASVAADVSLASLNLSAGVEASALRGTREFAAVTVTGDPALDKLKKNEDIENLLFFAPSIGKEVWSGEYKENEDE